MCKEFDHQYPLFEPGTFPLRTPVPWSYNLAFGAAGFERGWVAIKEDRNGIYMETIEKVKDKLLDLVRKVRIMFLAREDMDGALGAAHYDMQEILGIFEKEAKRKKSREEPVEKISGTGKTTDAHELAFSWDVSLQPTIALEDSLYWMFFGAFSKQGDLQNNLNLAIILGHELAHLTTKS
jgi:hypothetical protein